MFTSILKVALWIEIVGGIIVSIIVALSSGEWWWFLFGPLITFISASVLGTLVETSENTERCLSYICNINGRTLKKGEDPWFCEKCRKYNPPELNSCKHCGSSRFDQK